MTREENELDDLAPWLAITLTLIGGFLRVLLNGAKGMSLDETISVWLASHAVADMLQWIARIDQHPPLYYLLLHYWIAVYGATPYYVRLFSALFGAATIPLVYLIGKRISGALVGLAAAMLLALSPFNIRLAQDARMYTLVAFNAAVAVYALVRLLTDPRSARPIGSQFGEYLRAWRTSGPEMPSAKRHVSYRDTSRDHTGWRAWIFNHRWLPIQAIETDLAWVAFIVFSAAAVLSHSTAVLFPLAVNVFVLGLMLFQRMHRSGSVPAFQAPTFWNWVKAQVGILLLCSPWMPAFIRQAGRSNPEFWIPGPGWDTVTRALRSFLNENTLPPADLAWPIWLLYAALLCLGLLHYRKRASRFLFLASLFAIPFLGELILSVRRPVFLDRTLLWITIPLFLVLGAGIVQLRFRLLMIAALGVLGTNSLFSVGDYYRFMPKEDWSTAAGYVAKSVENGDLILFNTAWAQIPFDYYFQAYEEQYFIDVEKHGLPVDLADGDMARARMLDGDIPALASMIRGHNRVWLVYSYSSYADPTGLVPQTLASGMTLIRQRDFYGGQVQLYGSP